MSISPCGMPLCSGGLCAASVHPCGRASRYVLSQPRHACQLARKASMHAQKLRQPATARTLRPDSVAPGTANGRVSSTESFSSGMMVHTMCVASLQRSLHWYRASSHVHDCHGVLHPASTALHGLVSGLVLPSSEIYQLLGMSTFIVSHGAASRPDVCVGGCLVRSSSRW